MKRILIPISLTLLLVLLMFWARPARAQLGNLDDCDQFYRFAKAYLWLYDYRLPADKINALKVDQEFSPEKSAAFSQLYLACMRRNSEFLH